eukprot:TRINITY_DN14888_c0_g1_i5.p1 TRINITY_DN14888_c0_g1~~TRINITY_DN14888_c0_g1_i5.p1  ORF type:complete len:181 (+),score=49.00 TRINITY_DN14888_c0_g1_i5:76-618(+)
MTMTPLYDLSSLPSTLSTMTPNVIRKDCEELFEDKESDYMRMVSAKSDLDIDRGLLAVSGTEEKGHAMFSSSSLVPSVSGTNPPNCQPLSREEAWEFYLAKLDEEANYLTVPEEVEEDICTCPSCTASYEVLYEGYMLHSKYSDIIANNDTANVTLASDDEVKMMKSILHEKENTMCVIM